MNDTSESSEVQGSAFLPIVLLSLAVSFFLIFQLSNIYEQRSNLNQDFANKSKEIDETVKRSQVTQQGLEILVRQLLELANSGDTDAKRIIEKYGIKVTQPAGAPATPSAR